MSLMAGVELTRLVELYDGAAGGAGLARLALPAASGGGDGCERLGLSAEALEVLRAAGEHHRRCRHFGCGTLVERDPAVARSDHQLILGTRQVVAMTGHSADSTPPGRDSRTLACGRSGAQRREGPGESRRRSQAHTGTYRIGLGFLVASTVVTIKMSLKLHSHSYGSQHEAENREGSAGYEKAGYRQSEGNG
jgi:hypothetical protein